MNKSIKILMCVAICLISLTGMVFAWSVQPNANIGMPGGSGDLINNILGALQLAGMIVGIFILIFFGFKYLTAGAGEKAKTKEMLVPFLIGAAVIILAPALAKWVWGLTKSTSSSTTTSTTSSTASTPSTTNSQIIPLPSGKGPSQVFVPWN